MKYLKLILLCVFTLSFVACDDDDDPYYIESEIVGRYWTGEVGAMDGDQPLLSTFHFASDGFGEEVQFCPHCNREFGPYRFQWYWEDRYSNSLVLDYGKRGVCFMEDLSLRGRRLYGLFIDEFNHAFDFRLEMD